MKKIIISVLIIVLITFSFNYVNKIKQSRNENLLNIYFTAIDYILDDSLRILAKKKYLVINPDTIEGLNNEEIDIVFEHLSERYEMEVLGSKPTGLPEENEYAYLYFEGVTNTMYKVKIEIAFGYDFFGEGTLVEVSYVEGKWLLTNITGIWIT